jgi:hypothetical protein
MKRKLLAAFVFGLFGTGCMPGFLETSDQPPAARVARRPPTPAVTPEQVSPANAHEIARLLEEEMHGAQPQGIQPTRPLALPND